MFILVQPRAWTPSQLSCLEVHYFSRGRYKSSKNAFSLFSIDGRREEYYQISINFAPPTGPRGWQSHEFHNSFSFCQSDASTQTSCSSFSFLYKAQRTTTAIAIGYPKKVCLSHERRHEKILELFFKILAIQIKI